MHESNSERDAVSRISSFLSRTTISSTLGWDLPLGVTTDERALMPCGPETRSMWSCPYPGRLRQHLRSHGLAELTKNFARGQHLGLSDHHDQGHDKAQAGSRGTDLEATGE